MLLECEINRYLSRYNVHKILLELDRGRGFFDSLISRSFYPYDKEDKFTIRDVSNDTLKMKDKEKIINKLSTKVSIFTKEQFDM